MIAKTTLRLAVAALALAGATSAAQATCNNRWADVTSLCPNPLPYTGPRTLTETSRNMPTVGTPGTYTGYGNGPVTVYRSGNGTGYQDFQWAQREMTPYPPQPVYVPPPAPVRTYKKRPPPPPTYSKGYDDYIVYEKGQ